MDKCINISHKDFQELIRQSNINPLILKSKVGVWQEANNSDEFPTLEQLGIKESKSVGRISKGALERNQAEIERISLEELKQVNEQASAFLNNFGFNTRVLPSLNLVSNWNAFSATDMLEKVIYVQEDKLDEVYSLEASYVIFNLLGKKNILRKRIIETIHLMDGYKEKAAKYSDKYPEYYIRELIAVEYLRDKFKDAHKEALEGNPKIKSEDASSKNSKGEKSQLKYYILKIKKLWFDILNVFFKRKQAHFVDTALNEIIKNVLANNTKLFQTNNETNIVEFEMTKEQEELLEKLTNLNLVISGSYALSKQGQLKRASNQINDFDFFVPNDKVSTILDEIRELYPSMKVIAEFGSVYGKDAKTVTIDIDRFHIDLFIPVDSTWGNSKKVVTINGKKYLYWKNIFDAKLRIGNKKHLRDLAGYTPNIPEQTTLDIVGQRHFNFEAYIPTVKNIVDAIQNLPENHTDDDILQIYSEFSEDLPDNSDLETLEDLVDINLSLNEAEQVTQDSNPLQEYSIYSGTPINQDGYVRTQNTTKKTSTKQDVGSNKEELKRRVANVKTRNIDPIEEDKIISDFQKIEGNEDVEKVLRYLAAKFNSHYEIYADKDDNRKGYVEKTGLTYTVYLNAAKATSDTPYHEFGHILLELIRRNNITLYSSLIKEITQSGVGKRIINEKEELYPNLDYEDVVEEAMTDILGKLSVKSLQNITEKTLENIFEININKIPVRTTFNELSELLAYGVEKISFNNMSYPRYSVTHNFPVEVNGVIEIYTGMYTYDEYNESISVSFYSGKGLDTKGAGLFHKVLPRIIEGISAEFSNIDYKYISFYPIMDSNEPIVLNSGKVKERKKRPEGSERLIGYNVFAKRIFDVFSLVAENKNTTVIPIPKMFRNFRENTPKQLEQRDTPRSIGRISTKQDPVIILNNEENKSLYEKEGLLINGKTERIKTVAKLKKAKAEIEQYNNNPEKQYSITLRKVDQDGNGSIYSKFLAEKFVPQVDNTSNKKNNVVGRVATKFQSTVKKPTNNEENVLSYLAFKKDLKIAVQKKFEEYKTLNSYKKNTPEYKTKVIKFNTILSKLKAEIETVKVDDTELILKIFYDEINELNEIIDKVDLEDLINYEVDDRIEKLNNILLGMSIKDRNKKGLVIIDSSSFKNYGDITNRLAKLIGKYEMAHMQITLNLLKTNPIYVAQTLNKTQDELDELEKQVQGLIGWVDEETGEYHGVSDIGFFEEYFLGANGNDDSIGITVIDLNLKYNKQLAEQVVFKDCQKLKELDSKLDRKGIKSEIFFEKDKHGVKTGNIAHLYSSEFFDELEDFYELNEDFNFALKEDKIKFYRDKIAWLWGNTEVIDFRKLSYFKDKFGSVYGKHFKFTDTEMSEYEEILRRNLGKYYDIMIEELEENLNDFETFKTSKEMEDNEYKYKNIYEESPWEFLENYYNTFDPNQALRPVDYDHYGRHQQALLKGNYNSFVPRKSIKNGAYYNKDFDKIQQDEDTFNYWNTLRTIHSKHIDPILTSKGISMHNFAYAKFLKEAPEILQATKGNEKLKGVFNNLLTSYQNLFLDTRATKTPKGQEEVVKNYSDGTLGAIKRFTDILKLHTPEKLAEMINERDIILDRSKKLNKREVAEIIARHDVLLMYSEDLTKITLAISDLASMHKAQIETANNATFVKRFNSEIKDSYGGSRERSKAKLESWIKTNIYNDRNSEAFEKGGKETLINLGKVFNKTDKKLKQIINEVRKGNGDKAFTLNNIQYYKIGNIYKALQEIKKDDGESYNTIEIQLTKEEFENKLEEYFSKAISETGIPISLHSLINGILKVTIINGLGLNPKSGVNNRLEGSITNIIKDSEGTHWKTGLINYARDFMGGINLTRLSEGRLTINGKNRSDQQKTFIQLFENLGVYQDRKNELDRKNTTSKFGRAFKNVNIYTPSVDLSEFKNQGEILFCMLADIEITDKYGNTEDENGVPYTFFNKETMEFTLFEPGTTTVKEDFRTPENLVWETFHLNNETTNQFFVHRWRVDDAIKNIQGNYAGNDSIMIHDKLWGRAIMTFHRWLPEHLNQRYGERKFNIYQKNSKYIGRHRAMYRQPLILSLYSTAIMATKFGFTTATAYGAGAALVLPFILKYVIGSKFKSNKQLVIHAFQLGHLAKMLQEVVVQSMNLPLKVLRVKKQVKPLFKEFSLDNISNETSDFSIEEVRAMKGICMEIAFSLQRFAVQLALLALWKSLGFPDGDDDDDEKKKHSKDWDRLAEQYFFNYCFNTIDRLGTSFESFSNPVTIWNQNSKIAIIRTAKELNDFRIYFIKYTKDEERGGLRMVSKIMGMQPILPITNTIGDALFRDAEKVGWGQYPFFDKKNYVKGSWMDDAVKSPEDVAEKTVNAQRAVLGDELELQYRHQLREYSPELTEYEVQEEAKKLAKEALNETYKNGNKKSRTRSSRTRTKSKRKKESESYEETLERFEELKPEIEEKYDLD